MTHRTDAKASITAARNALAEIQGQRTPTDVTIANAARAQAILALGDTLNQQEPT
jgi:hypothetical protein